MTVEEPGELWNLGIALKYSMDAAEIQQRGSDHFI